MGDSAVKSLGVDPAGVAVCVPVATDVPVCVDWPPVTSSAGVGVASSGVGVAFSVDVGVLQIPLNPEIECGVSLDIGTIDQLCDFLRELVHLLLQPSEVAQQVTNSLYELLSEMLC